MSKSGLSKGYSLQQTNVNQETLLYTHAALLSTDNMREMLDLTWDYRAKWRFIGIQLGIDSGTLEAIDANNNGKVEGCLAELINHWLCNNDPRPTRGAIISAIKSKLVATSDAGIYIYFFLYYQILE